MESTPYTVFQKGDEFCVIRGTALVPSDIRQDHGFDKRAYPSAAEALQHETGDIKAAIQRMEDEP